MMLFSNIQNYLKQLCREHVSLRHETNGKSFIPMTQGDESPAAVTGIKTTYVKLVDISSNGRDENTLVYSVLLYFLKNLPVSAGSRNAKMEAAMNETQRIMMDFEARMRQDADDEDKCFFANNLLEPNMEIIETTDQNAVGWSMTWRFTTDKQRHDPARWLISGGQPGIFQSEFTDEFA